MARKVPTAITNVDVSFADRLIVNINTSGIDGIQHG
jgi:hypothetical protein